MADIPWLKRIKQVFKLTGGLQVVVELVLGDEGVLSGDLNHLEEVCCFEANRTVAVEARSEDPTSAPPFKRIHNEIKKSFDLGPVKKGRIFRNSISMLKTLATCNL